MHISVLNFRSVALNVFKKKVMSRPRQTIDIPLRATFSADIWLDTLAFFLTGIGVHDNIVSKKWFDAALLQSF